MKSRLKNLYKYLIENRKHEVKGWHDAYREFYGQVGQIRERIKSGEGLSQTDEAFLKQLLYEKATESLLAASPCLSNENFQAFIKNKDFLSALEEFILTPNKENFQKFDDAWSAQGKSNNPVLVNRVAAAAHSKSPLLLIPVSLIRSSAGLFVKELSRHIRPRRIKIGIQKTFSY